MQPTRCTRGHTNNTSCYYASRPLLATTATQWTARKWLRVVTMSMRLIGQKTRTSPPRGWAPAATTQATHLNRHAKLVICQCIACTPRHTCGRLWNLHASCVAPHGIPGREEHQVSWSVGDESLQQDVAQWLLFGLLAALILVYSSQVLWEPNLMKMKLAAAHAFFEYSRNRVDADALGTEIH